MTKAALEKMVDVFSGCNLVLNEKDCLVDGEHQDAVGNEARHIIDHDAFLAHLR